MNLPSLPYNLEQSLIDKIKHIKLALFDVDGVLTDGKLHYGPNGEEMKVFHALDGHGLKMLQMAGIDVGIISARRSTALQTRLNDLGIKHDYLGVNDKLDVFKSLQDQLGIDNAQCAFTGDDVIDLEVMQACGTKFSVENGHFIVKNIADWVAPLTGGNGAVRAICDVILYCQNNYPLSTSHSVQ
ncbi:MAG: HAD-IIIA family hydrolase [Gammaproteobacteria bacterium]|nr:HAD-IIIA family hydrolase [Gammaproteobacteria bacterium]